MSHTHIVQQGEHISAIAAKNGFGNYHTIWDHPENAELAAERDPHVLFPGDRIFIPERKEKTESRATAAVHTFQADVVPLFLRVRLENLEEVPVANTSCDVTTPPNSKPSNEKTDRDGKFLKQIPREDDMIGRIVAHVPLKKPAKEDPDRSPEKLVTYDLHIGNLNPKTKLSGQQARLNNLGYFAGYTVRDVDALLWAAEEFHCEHISKPVAKRPEIKPAPAKGEEVPDPAAAKLPTGIQDKAIVDKLVELHGI